MRPRSALVRARSRLLPTIKAALRHKSADSEEDREGLGCHLGQGRTRSSGQPCYGAREAVGGLVPCSKEQALVSHVPKRTIPAGPRLEPADVRLQARLSNH